MTTTAFALADSTLMSRLLLSVTLNWLLTGCLGTPGAEHQGRTWWTEDWIPKGGLATLPRVAANNQPTKFHFEGQPKPRQQSTGGKVASAGLSVFGCIVYLPVCTMTLPAGAVVQAMDGGEDDDSRVAKILLNEATTNNLQHRVSALIQPTPPVALEYPRLDVALTYIEQRRFDGPWVRITLRAEATAVLGPDDKWKTTQHTVVIPTRRNFQLLGPDAQLLRQELDAAMDILANSINAAYLPANAKPPTQN